MNSMETVKASSSAEDSGGYPSVHSESVLRKSLSTAVAAGRGGGARYAGFLDFVVVQGGVETFGFFL